MERVYFRKSLSGLFMNSLSTRYWKILYTAEYLMHWAGTDGQLELTVSFLEKSGYVQSGFRVCFRK